MLNAVFEENAFHGFVSNAKKSQQYFFTKLTLAGIFKNCLLALVQMDAGVKLFHRLLISSKVKLLDKVLSNNWSVNEAPSDGNKSLLAALIPDEK